MCNDLTPGVAACVEAGVVWIVRMKSNRPRDARIREGLSYCTSTVTFKGCAGFLRRGKGELLRRLLPNSTLIPETTHEAQRGKPTWVPAYLASYLL